MISEFHTARNFFPFCEKVHRSSLQSDSTRKRIFHGRSAFRTYGQTSPSLRLMLMLIENREITLELNINSQSSKKK